MKNRKVLLPALLSMALVFSQILPGVVAEASDDYNSPRSARSATGRILTRSPQANITRWGLRTTAPWSL